MRMNYPQRTLYPRPQRGSRAPVRLRFFLVWLLNLALCSQAMLTPVALANDASRRRAANGNTAPKESRPAKRPAAKPRAAQTNAVNVVNVSAASFENTVTPDSIMSAFGTSLATSTASATSVPLPTTLAGTTVRVRDSADVERLAQLFFVSAGQINYLLPTDTAAGPAVVTIISGSGVISQGTIQVNAVGPGIFTANANGLGAPAAVLLRVRGGQQSFETLSQLDPLTNRFEPRPIDPGPASDQLFLLLFLTGLRRAPNPNNDGNANESVRVLIGGTEVTPLFAGKQGGLVGLDQVNVEIPRSLAGRGRLSLVVTVNGFNSSNITEIDLGATAGVAPPVPPQLTGFSTATVIAGQSLTINGSGFAANVTDNLVRIGDKLLVEQRLISATNALNEAQTRLDRHSSRSKQIQMAPRKLSSLGNIGAEADTRTLMMLMERRNSVLVELAPLVARAGDRQKRWFMRTTAPCSRARRLTVTECKHEPPLASTRR